MKTNQKTVVLDYMSRFGAITPYDAFRDLGITRLAAVIHNLKKDGVNINTETLKTTNRYGKAIYFARYSIHKGV